MERLTPIPTSWTTRWSLIRQQVLPFLAFAMVTVGVVVTWQQVATGNLAGMAEGAYSLVSSPQNAVLETLLVEPFTSVTAGQPLAVLVPTDPRAAFDLWQAELTRERLHAEPSVAEANAMSFERFRTDLLRVQSELEVARVNLQRAEREVLRYTPLRQENLLSEDLFELSQSARDALRAEVESKEKMVNLLQGRAAALQSLGVPNTNLPTKSAQLGHLERLRAAALTNLAPVTLFAPRSGLVQGIFRQPGEHVVLGEPILQISPWRSDRIVGYARQPYPFTLRPGLKVDVITREQPRRQFTSEIAQVGARLEVITNALAFVRPNTLVDSGLPFVVRLPADLDLRPGEIVDLRVHPEEPDPPRPEPLPAAATAHSQTRP